MKFLRSSPLLPLWAHYPLMDEGEAVCEMSHLSSCGFCASWGSLAWVQCDAEDACRETKDRWNRGMTHLCGGQTGLLFYKYFSSFIPYSLLTVFTNWRWVKDWPLSNPIPSWKSCLHILSTWKHKTYISSNSSFQQSRPSSVCLSPVLRLLWEWSCSTTSWESVPWSEPPSLLC